MAYTRPTHGSNFSDSSATDATVLVGAIATGLEAVEANRVGNDVTITLPDTVTKIAKVNIVDTPGDSNTANWPDRFAFYYKTVRSGYFNEYGELRGRPGTSSTVALRAMGHTTANDVDIFEVANTDSSVLYFKVNRNGVTATVPITAPNIGVKVSSGTTAPSSPATGDVWIDTN